ncbi:MAG: hypothetical protein F4Y88_02065 [Chloroflexi bacterium]|nr:hypothetical protein [Chloroflexota bacterium]
MEGKLGFQGVRLLRVIYEKGVLQGLRLGVQFRNQANAEMTFIVVTMHTSLIDTSNQRSHYPPSKQFEKNEFIVRPNDIVIFDHYDIPLPANSTGDFVAEVRCTISYGKRSNAKYSLQLAKRGDFAIHNGVITGTIVWYDA